MRRLLGWVKSADWDHESLQPPGQRDEALPAQHHRRMAGAPACASR